MSEPTDGLTQYQSIKRVLAGEITEVVAAGCYVKQASGDTILRIYEPNMATRYSPSVGDFWVVYPEDGYQSLSPRKAFLAGYIPLSEVPASPSEPLSKAVLDLHLADRIQAEVMMDRGAAAVWRAVQDAVRTAGWCLVPWPESMLRAENGRLAVDNAALIRLWGGETPVVLADGRVVRPGVGE
jgi:hypothetical protein